MAWVINDTSQCLTPMTAFCYRFLVPPPSRIRSGSCHDDDSFQFLLGRIGSKRIFVGTDFPFDWDHPGGAANWIRNMSDLSDDVKKDILWNTAAEFLATKVPYREVS